MVLEPKYRLTGYKKLEMVEITSTIFEKQYNLVNNETKILLLISINSERNPLCEN